MGGLPPQARHIGTLAAYAAFALEAVPARDLGPPQLVLTRGFLHGLASGPPQLAQEKKTARLLVLQLLQTLALGASSLALDYLIAKLGASSLSITICPCRPLSRTRDEACFCGPSAVESDCSV
jgi:hypothetical protein